MLYCAGHDDDSGQHARYGLSVTPQSISDAAQASALRIANPADMMCPSLPWTSSAVWAGGQ